LFSGKCGEEIEPHLLVHHMQLRMGRKEEPSGKGREIQRYLSKNWKFPADSFAD
jgi:hypothetical protein